MKEPLVEISKSTVRRYSKRFKSLGYNVRTLGWGTEEQQQYRFEQVVCAVDVNDKSVLDIGCGFGDLKTYCDEVKQTPSSYIGWDINPDLIDTASLRHADAKFYVVDLINNADFIPTAQVGVMLGLLNFNLKGVHDNIDYSRKMILNAFKCVTETLVIDFLSTNKTPDYPSEDFVYYHDPAEMLRFALELTPNVKLLHDYSPIPQKEFMLILSK